MNSHCYKYGFILILIGLISSPDSIAELIANEEKQSRQVDQVALESQNAATAKLKGLIQRYKNTAQEPILLMRLAQIYQESASILFRLAYSSTGTSAQRSRSKLIYSSQIQILNRLIETYPHYSNLDHALLMRGKSYEELEQPQKAKQDYLTLVHTYPHSEYALPTYMALAEIAIKNNLHTEALSYFSEVEKHSKSPFYPFALYKSAWSHFNLKNFPMAISYLERHVKYYDSLTQSKHILTSSDSAIRENSLLDYVSFYLEGNESPDNTRFPLEKVLQTFKNLESGPLLGKMNLKLARLLRSHRRDNELIFWKNQLIQEESQRPETMDVVITLFEHQLNQGSYNQALLTAYNVALLFKQNAHELQQTLSYTSATNTLLEATSQLQSRYIKAKKNNSTLEASLFAKSLSQLYPICADILIDTDPRVFKIHYNLAELLFQIKQFANATPHYFWVYQHWHKDLEYSQLDLLMKLIASRYEVLREEHWIPERISAREFDTSSEGTLKSKLSASAWEWIKWIDLASRESEPGNSDLENFQFEANRSIYIHVGTGAAFERLIRFTQDNPQSKFAIASAKLAIDTLIHSEKWEDSYKLSVELSKLKWSTSEFRNQLTLVSSDSLYKIAESNFQSQQYEKAIDRIEQLKSEFPKSTRIPEALYLAGLTYLSLHKHTKAIDHFTKLVQDFPQSQFNRTTSLKLAQLADQAYDFKSAIKYYSHYLASQNSHSNDTHADSDTILKVQKRVLYLHWLEDDLTLNCSPGLTLECERYQAARLTQNSLNIQNSLHKNEDRDIYLKKALHGDSENRAIWSAFILSQDSSLQVRELLNLIRNLSKGWNKLDPQIQLTLLPVLNQTLPQSFQRAQLALRREVPLKKASSQAIIRRAEWIKEYENIATLALELPWNRIKSAILLELASLYQDFSSTLSQLPIPEELSSAERSEYEENVSKLVQPFLKKAQEIRDKAFVIASRASVEDELLQLTQKAAPQEFQKTTLQLQEAIALWEPHPQLIPIDISLVIRVSPDFALQTSGKDNENIQSLRKLWLDSFKNKNWAKNLFFIEEMKQNKHISENEIKILQGITLAALGAKAEALILFQSLAESNDRKLKTVFNEVLFLHYAHSLSVDKAQHFAKEVNQLRSQIVGLQKGDTQ